ncbi:hypothetical protein V8E54_001306 [Elaphomyces granulatus]
MVINQVECWGHASRLVVCLTATACSYALFRLPTLPTLPQQSAISHRELEASAEECPDRELEASAEEYPDKELKASVVKELDPPAQTITSVDGCPDRELETSVEGFMGPNKPRWRFLDG